MVDRREGWHEERRLTGERVDRREGYQKERKLTEGELVDRRRDIWQEERTLAGEKVGISDNHIGNT